MVNRKALESGSIAGPMQELDEQLNKLVKVADSLQGSLTNHLAEARRWRNSQLPIHRQIPCEVFVSVVDLASRKDLELKPLSKLSAVCYSWRRIIEDTPSLWNCIHSWDRPKLVDKALVKSEGTPLDITFFCDDTYGHFPDRIAPHMGRFRSVVLALRSNLHIPLFVPPAAPLLEKLEIHISEPNPENPPIQMSEDEMPRLRHLELRNANVHIGTFSRLQHLHVDNGPESSPSIQSLVHILRNNPELQSLDLKSVARTEIPLQMDASPIHLPHLHRLFLEDFPHSDCAQLVSSIHAPSLSFFGTRSSTLSSTLLTPLVQGLAQVIRPVASLKGSIDITFHDDGDVQNLLLAQLGPERGRTELGINTCQVAYTASLSLRASLDNELLKLIIDTLFHNLRDAEVNLELRFHWEQAPWRTWLTAIPCITKLRLENYSTQIVVIGYLSHRGDDGWPCPELQRLHVDAQVHSCHDAVLEMVTNRHRSRPDEGANPNPPKPLEMLIVQTPRQNSDAVWREVIDVMGRDRVLITPNGMY